MARHKPGPGWRRLGVSVWERGNLRIHGLGIVRLPSGRFVCVHASHWSPRYQRIVRVLGGNNRRALMVMAIELEREEKGGA